MELTISELIQMETLLRKAHKITAEDYPYYGRTTQIWVGDKIDRTEETNQRKIERGKK